MRRKKGQAGQIPILILVIGVILVVYILMLPPPDRAELLDQNRTSSGGSDEVKDEFTVLMTKRPGTLTNIPDTEIYHDLPGFSLFTKTDAIEVRNVNSIVLQKSLFDEQNWPLEFDVSDFNYKDNFVLSFNAPTNEGVLTITLNDRIIFSKDINTQSPSPITIPKDLLQDTNTLLFEVSGPGMEFWETNEYVLENVRLTADYTDTSAQDNIQMIYVTEKEIENLESMELSFIVECKESEVSPLEIQLNKNKIYLSVPDCGMKIKVPIVDGRDMREGKNDLIFRTEKGNYQIYSLEVKLNLNEPLFPTYYFILSQDQIDKLDNDKADLNVTMLFPNKEDRKKGYFMVNGAQFEIDTYDNKYTRKIDAFVREGNNAVEIRPESDKLDVTELQLIFAE